MMILINVILGFITVLFGLNTFGRGWQYFGFMKTEDSFEVCFPQIKLGFPFTNLIISLLITIFLIMLIMIL